MVFSRRLFSPHFLHPFRIALALIKVGDFFFALFLDLHSFFFFLTYATFFSSSYPYYLHNIMCYGFSLSIQNKNDVCSCQREKKFHITTHIFPTKERTSFRITPFSKQFDRVTLLEKFFQYELSCVLFFIRFFVIFFFFSPPNLPTREKKKLTKIFVEKFSNFATTTRRRKNKTTAFSSENKFYV